ncbi:4a-hydroxytetrahydrobiopterin dehydratase [Gaoshiqia sediminis]|uniref:Putative pterin-4-alpha-carbinolamine dehydratase n=1 Tax=Gaoshiqia sediminis TaxID=2986998 RepID=A0AA41YA68_9BACT|nr:4a-hydroxytetrahydrobiopterin dehydratase [Gaoshiqia sediminis]MCW0482110.1 4a-hydroxytetrahydrobiopterin dehydratase [Gaoshiqia sediminis]
MNKLNEQICEVCRVGAPQVTDEEIAWLKPQVPEWKIVKNDGIKKLTRTYSFANFREAINFTQKVGALAEEQGHHPALLTEWGKVTVTWWTHKIRGLHRNDFIMAAKTDLLI